MVSLEHKELQRKILEIGRIEGYLTDKEEDIMGFRVDCVWFTKKSKTRIIVAFEVELSKQIAKSLTSLKTAYEDNGCRGVLVVREVDLARARSMLEESFRELDGIVNVLEDKDIDELLEAVTSGRIIKEKIGYKLVPF